MGARVYVESLGPRLARVFGVAMDGADIGGTAHANPGGLGHCPNPSRATVANGAAVSVLLSGVVRVRRLVVDHRARSVPDCRTEIPRLHRNIQRDSTDDGSWHASWGRTRSLPEGPICKGRPDNDLNSMTVAIGQALHSNRCPARAARNAARWYGWFCAAFYYWRRWDLRSACLPH